jgi:diadenosine tetraphosphate (Ap4A) HIT family hydrolase
MRRCIVQLRRAERDVADEEIAAAARLLGAIDTLPPAAREQEGNMSDCVFCAILRGDQPGSLFYADDEVVGLLDINPVTEGHALIIPRRHAADLAALDEATGQRLWTVAQRTAAALRASGLRCEGVNLFLADGAAAFQEVFHVHLHVFPRYAGDGFTLNADWSHRPPREALDATALALGAAYGRRYP